MTKEQLIELVIFTAGEILAPTELSMEDAESIVDEFVDAEQLTIPVVRVSLPVEIKNLLEQYRNKEMPNWNTPFHYDAKGWSAMEYFIEWLERNRNDR